ncbi:MAG: hypothetical protein ACXVAX_02155, partial [Pseudobdellovibrio sp.]
GYDLRRVNLINGPNGTGKTSFLEMIELTLCGRTARNPLAENSSTELSLKIVGLNEDEVFEEGNKAKYRTRDLLWYDNNYEKDNRLHESFRKFNFFDTDNAFRLAYQAQDKSALVNAFSTLALGENATTLYRRISSFNDTFRRHKNNMGKKIVDLQNRLSAIQAELLALTPKANESELLVPELEKAILSIKWKNNLDVDNVDEIIVNVNKTISLLERLGAAVSWISPLTANAMEAELKSLVIESKNLETNLKKIVALKSERAEIETSGKAMAQVSTWLKRLNEYVSHPKIAELENIAEKLTRLGRILSTYEQANNIFKKLELDLLRDGSETISQLIDANNHMLTESKKDLIESDRLLSSIRSLMGKVSSLSSQLKQMGMEYISLDRSNCECPLCSHKFDSVELLAEGMNKHSSKSQDTEEIKLLISKIDSARKKIAVSEKNLNLLESFKKGISLIMEQNLIASLPTKELYSKAIAAPEMIENMKKRQAEMSVTKSQFDSLSFGFKEYEEILFNLSNDSVLSQVEIDLSSSSSIEQVNLQIQDKLVETRVRYKEKSDKINELVHLNQDIAFKNGMAEADADETIAKIKTQINSIENGKLTLGELTEVIAIGESENYRDIQLSLENVQNISSRYKKAVVAESEKSKFFESKNTEFNKLKDEIDQLKPTFKRLSDAFNVLEDIVDNDSKEKNLELFLAKYREQILQIFMTIHSPREFTDMQLISENGDITLKRADGTEASLSTISTGQRAALALSVFLTLNLSVKAAPNLILIDDPVAHIDDLNILGFLDYLRELVVNKDKQIFFATADSKVASLFSKKFKFLGDADFKTFDFKPEL